MQDYTKTNRLSLKTFLIFTVILFIAYLPISSFLFFLKNDAFTGYFPPKFFMSESIHAGYLPLWNPYINFGFPQYGDMSGGYWSPVTWFIASTIGYNAYSFTIEVLMYILLGGLGMYKLSGYWIPDKNIRTIAGMAFMCCGYHVAHLQHFNWLSGSAFLPWCFWSYLIFLNKRTIHNSLTSVVLFYLFIASAHPGLVIGAFYFFIAILFFIFLENEQQLSLKVRLIKFSLAHFVFISLILILGTGIIAGYTDIIPHFVRGEKIRLESSLPHSSNIKTWISVLFPFSTVKNDAFFNTELTLRNSYFSLTLLLLFLMALFGKKNKWQKFLFFSGLSFAVLSAGGWAKTFAHQYFPFIGYVRLNGEFRIFAIIAFILIASIELEKFIKNKQPTNHKNLKWVSAGLMMILFCSITWALYSILISKKSIVFNITNLESVSGFAEQAKYIVDTISFYDTIWMQGFAQMVLLIFVYKSLKAKNIRRVQWLVIADIVFSSFVYIPYTGAGKTSVAHLQSVINLSPKGIPIPQLHPIIYNDTISTADNALLGNWSMYNKQPGTLTETPYPIQLKNMRAFFDFPKNKDSFNYFKKPFLFLKEGNAIINILNFSPNKIVITVTADTASRLIIQQNYYPYWFYEKNGETHKVLQEDVSFMAVPLNKGINEINLTFKPTFIKAGLFISTFFFVLYVFIIALYKSKRL